MADTKYRIVSDDESEIHDKFHLVRIRVTVRQLHTLIEEAEIWPQQIADGDGLNVDKNVKYRIVYKLRNDVHDVEHVDDLTGLAKGSSD
jgi:hypothetical protein